MIIGFRAFQDKGKTAMMVATGKQILFIGSEFDKGYRTSDVVANLHLPKWDGALCLTNPKMREYIDNLVKKGLAHKILMIDEADRVFPARFWQKKEQTEALIGLWQDVKLFNIVLYTAHEGTSIDVMLRSVTQIEITPEYNSLANRIDFRVYNAWSGIVFDDSIENISSKVFNDYDRWERVV